jgi:catechol 2,3-dioxygenase-like lactoylglutathione lyase family enzyme
VTDGRDLDGSRPFVHERGVNLNQVTVPCLDLDESVDFYLRLGLELIVLDRPKYARFQCPQGGATFSLHLSEHVESASAPVVYFELDDLDRRVKELQAAGLVFESEPRDQPWLWREAYLRDPAGNLLCLYCAGENRLFPPWRLTE